MYKWLFVLLFLLNLRRSSCPDLPTYLLTKYGNNIRQTYRRLETSLRRKHKAVCDQEFLLYCQFNDVLPNFVKFKLYRSSLYHTSFYGDATRDLLQLEIRSKDRLVDHHSKSSQRLYETLKSTLSFIDFIYVKSILSRNNESFISNVKRTHTNKLIRLGINKPKIPNCLNTVFNFSKYVLSKREEFLLSLGLDFCLPNYKPNLTSFYLPLELLFQRLRSLSLPCKFSELQRDLQSLSQKTYNTLRPSWLPFFKKDDYVLMRELAKNESIVILRPDKGKGAVLLDKAVYIDKMSNILQDNTKFLKIGTPTFSSIFKQEDKINRFLKQLKDNGVINNETYLELYSSGNAFGVLYGLPKIHKQDIPLRPILAAYNTPNYKIAKYISHLITPYSLNQYALTNSASLIPHILSQDSDLYMVSLDVTSLFTNVPLQATIQLILEKIFPNDNDLFHNFSKPDFRKFLELAVLDTNFIFNNTVYKQTDGVAMGSPLGPAFANIFMSWLETQILEQCPSSYKPIFYRRYVDDTFALFTNKASAELFLEFANSFHENVRFTMENETNNKLPFLDILIERTPSGFATGVYRKPTFTGQGTNFYSSCFYNFKLNSISTLLNRAYALSSDWLIFHKEVTFLTTFFKNNFYPDSLFLTFLNKFLEAKFRPASLTCTVPKLRFYASIPYTHNNIFGQKLARIITSHFPALDLKLIPKNPLKLGTLFYYKDRLPKLMQSNLSYMFSCPKCKVGTYIGATKRLLKVRADAHLGVSHRTGYPLSKKDFSNIREHCHKCRTSFDYNCFKIMGRACDETSLSVLESLLIKQHSPTLNNHCSATPLHIA